ncbi:hypothetical protein [Pseudomonas benzenivorans]|uniref:Uncharacterized protein n=1 Tax=Pseudomonas benzenivorans TaxID=556533 RepID=A0ABY5H1G6_9PSED|nr:hypothetical protein [Pseudomonas benzenivorans]UTW06105.1 hypothetical protein KDW96_13000 [Pseudomonas benzenivorans]
MKPNFGVGMLIWMVATNVSADVTCKCESFPFLPSPPCPKVCRALLIEKADIGALTTSLKLSNDEALAVERYRQRFGFANTPNPPTHWDVELTPEEIADVAKVKQKVVDLESQQIKPLIRTIKSPDRTVPYSEWVEHRQEFQLPIELKDSLQ